VDDDTQRLLRESAQSFVEKEGDMRRLRACREQDPGFDRDRWQSIANNGWLGLLLPKAMGGFGLGFAEACIVSEELGRGLIPEPITAAAVLAAGTLRGCDNTTLTDALLPAVIAGTKIPALAWQENNRDYNPDSIETRASADENCVRISGIKRFIPAAAGADGFLVTALGPEGTGLYWIESNSPGLALTLERSVDDVAWGTLELTGVPVPPQHIARTSGAAEVVNRTVDEARLCACAELVGVMSQALNLTLEYVKIREQFGQRIGTFQALQHRLADLFIQQELSRNTLARAVAVFDSTLDPARRATAVSAAKARASDAALLIARQAIQLHGGIGFTDECDIGLYFKRTLVLAAWLGNASVHRERFGRINPATSIGTQ